MPAVKLSPDAEALYTSLLTSAQTSEEGLKKLFFQSQIHDLASENSKDPSELLRLITELQSHGLLRTSRWQGALCWSTRPRSAAEQIRNLNSVERTLYEYVEDAHTQGIWLKDLKKRSGIEEAKVQKAMGKLEAGRLVKVIKNVKAPAQKTYMLFHLVPSDDVTGGSFFDAGDLDESLIEEVGNLIVFHVKMRSWVERKVRKRKRGAEDIEDVGGRGRRDEVMVLQLAHKAGGHDYPTAESIHNFVTTTDAIRASKAQQLTVAEIQGVIDVLCWDDKLEKVGRGYRTVRGVSFRPPGFGGEDDDDDDDEDGGRRVGNGLTQAPCGRCPVFELCGPGEQGPVNASNCVYFDDWLKTNA